MLVGFLLEGWDYLIVRAYLAKILSLAEADIQADPVGEAAGRSWNFIAESVEIALRRFYHKCARLAVVGGDNDGNRDLQAEDIREDPLHRRHWLHLDSHTISIVDVAFLLLLSLRYAPTSIGLPGHPVIPGRSY